MTTNSFHLTKHRGHVRNDDYALALTAGCIYPGVPLIGRR